MFPILKSKSLIYINLYSSAPIHINNFLLSISISISSTKKDTACPALNLGRVYCKSYLQAVLRMREWGYR